MPDGDNAVLTIEIDGSLTSGSVGFAVQAGGSGSTVRGLVLNGFGIGILLNTSATACAIEGNFIGTDPTGTIARPNVSNGGILVGGATNNVIGGAIPAARNVISGNTAAGIDMESGANGNTIQGNFIGVDATGAAALPNHSGMRIFAAAGNQIGGTTAGERNVISGNGDDAIDLVAGASTNMVRGNFIGTDATGHKALGNGSNGFFVASGSVGNMIGGEAAGAGNVISGNGTNGVALLNAGTTGNVVEGNLIGTAVDQMPLGNTFRGVVIQDATDNLIGGTMAGAGTLITGNGSDGILVLDDATTGNRILGNSISANGGLGIALAQDGPDMNDDGDIDLGPNHRQNYPVLDEAMFPGGTSSASGTLDSAPNRTYRIEIFGTPPATRRCTARARPFSDRS